jgi:hypothetical protein
VRVASEVCRAARRRPTADDAEVDALVATLPSPEELVDQRRARDVLRAVLEATTRFLSAAYVPAASRVSSSTRWSARETLERIG